MRSRNALAPSAATIVPTAGPYGNSGYATSGTISQNAPRTFSEASKFFRTSGWTFSVVPLMTPIRKRRRLRARRRRARRCEGARERRRVLRVASRDRGHDETAVLRRAAHRAELVERPAERHRAVPAHAAVRRPEAGHARERGGREDGARGLRADREAHEARRPWRRRAPRTTRPTRSPCSRACGPGPVNDASALL